MAELVENVLGFESLIGVVHVICDFMQCGILIRKVIVLVALTVRLLCLALFALSVVICGVIREIALFARALHHPLAIGQFVLTALGAAQQTTPTTVMPTIHKRELHIANLAHFGMAVGRPHRGGVAIGFVVSAVCFLCLLIDAL